MAEQMPLERPELTMSEVEAARLRAAYAGAGVILEYGSGGSTVLAAEMPGTQVFSVESDKAWARRMRGWFAAQPPAEGSRVDVIHVDIGRTRTWGQPSDDSGWRRFARYPLGVWSREGFAHPDVVLVDGRFRVGCALATAIHATRPVTLLFDDYAGRARLQAVERFIGAPAAMHGRMAEFDVTPRKIAPGELLDIIRYMQRP